jgi:26S proteasome regulatory subunit N8
MTDTLLETVQHQDSKMVVVHPTVLLSIVDHYNRIASGTSKRVVGVLLGEYTDNQVLDITNCYAVPFEEDAQEPDIWFFDHIYHEQMFNMMRRINAKERIVGWYSSGPKIKRNDIQINEIIRRNNTNPVFVVCNVQ